MKGERVFVNLRVRLVELAGVVEHEPEVFEAGFQVRVKAVLQFGADFFKVDRPFNDFVVIGKLLHVWQTQEDERKLAAFRIFVIAQSFVESFHLLLKIFSLLRLFGGHHDGLRHLSLAGQTFGAQQCLGPEKNLMFLIETKFYKRSS